MERNTTNSTLAFYLSSFISLSLLAFILIAQKYLKFSISNTPFNTGLEIGFKGINLGVVFLLSPLVQLSYHHFPFKAPIKKIHLVYHLIIGAFFCILHILLCYLLFHLFSFEPFNHPLGKHFNKYLLHFSHITFGLYWLLLGIFHFSKPRRKQQRIPAKDTAFLKQIAIKEKKQILLLATSTIQWIEAADHYLRLYTADRSYMFRERISNLEKQLHPDHFLRIHRSVIVNRDYIRSYIPHTNGEYFILLKNDKKLKVSRTYADKVKALLSS